MEEEKKEKQETPEEALKKYRVKTMKRDLARLRLSEAEEERKKIIGMQEKEAVRKKQEQAAKQGQETTEKKQEEKPVPKERKDLSQKTLEEDKQKLEEERQKLSEEEVTSSLKKKGLQRKRVALVKEKVKAKKDLESLKEEEKSVKGKLQEVKKKISSASNKEKGKLEAEESSLTRQKRSLGRRMKEKEQLIEDTEKELTQLEEHLKKLEVGIKPREDVKEEADFPSFKKEQTLKEPPKEKNFEPDRLSQAKERLKRASGQKEREQKKEEQEFKEDLEARWERKPVKEVPREIEEPVPSQFEKYPEKPSKKKRGLRRILIIGASFLVIAGVGGFLFWFFTREEPITPPPPPSPISELTCDSWEVVPSSGEEPLEVEGSGSFSGPEEKIISVRIEWGDGQTSQTDQLQANHTYGKGSYTSRLVLITEEEEITNKECEAEVNVSESEPEPEPEPEAPDPIFPIDNTKEIEIEDPEEISGEIESLVYSSFTRGEITRILFKKGNEYTTRDDFLNSFDIAPPSNLNQRLEEDMMLFFFTRNNRENRLGFAIKIKEGEDENVKAQMRAWEDTLMQDTEQLFAALGKKGEPFASSFKEVYYSQERVRFLTISRNDFGICYAVVDGKLILTSSLEEMQSVIEKIKE